MERPAEGPGRRVEAIPSRISLLARAVPVGGKTWEFAYPTIASLVAIPVPAKRTRCHVCAGAYAMSPWSATKVGTDPILKIYYWPLLGTALDAGGVDIAVDEVVVLNGYPGGPFT